MPSWLPLFNTGLILISGGFLACGYVFIRRRRVTAHHRCMITASVFAAGFLVVYVARWALFGSAAFRGPAPAYVAYLTILIPHVILAVAVGPLAFVTLRRAFGGNFGAHRYIARRTLPIWGFVAVSGWVVYLMLYVVPWGP